MVFFEKIDFSDFASEENQDRITDNVWIARENSGPLFNYYLENVPEYGCDSQTPSERSGLHIFKRKCAIIIVIYRSFK